MEVFKLGFNRDHRLVEITPLNPVFSVVIPHTSGTIQYPQYTPSAPGVYSVLLEVRDFSNNSRIARRFVLYDATSSVSLNNATAKLYVSSAVEETGYTWQTPAATGNQVTVSVAWPNYFVNHVHEDGLFLGEIEQYPIQFNEIQDDGVLSSQKYVADALDDNEEPRTRKVIPNFHGIIKYEIVWQPTADTNEPTSGWEKIPMKESFTATRTLVDGDTLRVWIRATDIMGNAKADSTVVKIDGTPPILQTNLTGKDYGLTRNIADGPYNFSSKITFAASDGSSGVHKIGFKAIVKTQAGATKEMYSNFTAANMQVDLTNPFCKIVDGVCFLPDQTLYLDNCWLTVTKSDLDTATAMVEVSVFNQAMLSKTTSFDIGRINSLQGLEKYNGPQNLRVVNKTPTGFRLQWDLPTRESCYGRADILIILSRRNANGEEVLHTFYTQGTSTFFDILGLDPETEYTLGLNIQSQGGSAQQTDLAVTTRTEKQASDGASTGGVVGAVVGVLAVVAIVVVVLVVLIRRGVIRPAERAREIGRRMTRRVRPNRRSRGEGHSNPAYNVNHRAKSMAAEELYLYGGMDTFASKSVLSRRDIVLESVIKTGHFANIYKAKYQGKTVVAKTLKENNGTNDNFLMKAKINFSSEKVGDHPNVLKYLGSVLDDTNMGPFILYEYCENGTLKEYLVQNKSSVTMDIQETLFRIGLDIAKGMEYLAGKGITHRRLAARNILLTFLNEVKIYGFGPQPEEEADGDAESGKKERIPIKWMAPECMTSTKDADEKSDVWSFGVVLWEVFSLGETPYENVKSRDLPDRLKKNVRLQKPEQCDDVWFGVMNKCWDYQPRKRPTFAEIRNELDTMFVASPGDDYYYYKR
ncbi:angiopoietin-1 receptor-like [Dreissena polymorpha]|nr:angiopoietin-1 receptor-like [Dreissena polymorpha]